jgi:hypothetical protein
LPHSLSPIAALSIDSQIRKQNTTKPPKINFHQKQQKNKISTKTTITTIARKRARRRIRRRRRS